MVDVSLEQKIADFHKARQEVRDETESRAWQIHRKALKQEQNQRLATKEDDVALFDRYLQVTRHAPKDANGIAPLISRSDAVYALEKVAWNENNTLAGTNGSTLLRRDSHTKFAPRWSNGKLVHRTPTKYLRSVEDMYVALEEIALKGATSLQYQLTRATVPFSPIYNSATQALDANRALAPTFFEHNFGEQSKEYRASIFNQLVEMATELQMSFVPRPYAVAFALVERLREQFGVEKAQAQVAVFAPFILYGIEAPQQTRTSTSDQDSVTRHYTHNGTRARVTGVASAAPKYTPQRQVHVTDRPTVQISYSPIFGGQVR